MNQLLLSRLPGHVHHSGLGEGHGHGKGAHKPARTNMRRRAAAACTRLLPRCAPVAGQAQGQALDCAHSSTCQLPLLSGDWCEATGLVVVGADPSGGAWQAVTSCAGLLAMHRQQRTSSRVQAVGPGQLGDAALQLVVAQVLRAASAVSAARACGFWPARRGPAPHHDLQLWVGGPASWQRPCVHGFSCSQRPQAP